ncbi:MAG: DUF123 domain-containing protein, partial [Gammaproteobacteria bacterium]|nr:DUF123 domain-containing protein [Gammaproteobacteria bacterium]
RARLRRHLARGKTLRWHIDYLLAAPAAQVVDVAVFDEEECAVNAATPGRVPVPGFGAGDCRTGCGAHLKYLGPMCGEKSRTNAAHRLSPCGHPVASSQ